MFHTAYNLLVPAQWVCTLGSLSHLDIHIVLTQRVFDRWLWFMLLSILLRINFLLYLLPFGWLRFESHKFCKDVFLSSHLFHSCSWCGYHLIIDIIELLACLVFINLLHMILLNNLMVVHFSLVVLTRLLLQCNGEEIIVYVRLVHIYNLFSYVFLI